MSVVSLEDYDTFSHLLIIIIIISFSKGHKQVVCQLLASSAEINATENTEEASTPLDYAIYAKNFAVAFLLVRIIIISWFSWLLLGFLL